MTASWCGLTRAFTSTALDAVGILTAIRDLGSVVTMQVEVRIFCTRCAKTKTARAPTKEFQHDRTERTRT